MFISFKYLSFMSKVCSIISAVFCSETKGYRSKVLSDRPVDIVHRRSTVLETLEAGCIKNNINWHFASTNQLKPLLLQHSIALAINVDVLELQEIFLPIRIVDTNRLSKCLTHIR